MNKLKTMKEAFKDLNWEANEITQDYYEPICNCGTKIKVTSMGIISRVYAYCPKCRKNMESNTDYDGDKAWSIKRVLSDEFFKMLNE